ncbi:Protein transport protein SSO2 [Lachnellula suecica]|uniref:Protein transport protein SSO2 n=1 Tax=Lachnellula suecica TaxID=602035 RepID=A0A8T9C6V8_9HELO|nr:Protein transport protein SSO2 [Lachnellula suecica]
MAQYGYGGGRANPFDQRGDTQQGGYGAQPPYAAAPPAYGRQQYGNAPAMGRDDYNGNVELEPLTPNGAQFGARPAGQNDSVGAGGLLNEVSMINKQLSDITDSRIPALMSLRTAMLNRADSTASTVEIDRESEDIMKSYQDLVLRVRKLKSDPATASHQQVGRLDTKLKGALQDYRMQDSQFRKKLEEQIARQFRIVRPDATPQEVQAAVQNTDPGQQVFAQALMQSNRRGQAQSTLNAVQTRHEEIQKIAEQMAEIGKLFNEMDELVTLQEAPVANIEAKGEEVVENMDKGNEQLGTAIVSARNTRKWKWWCLGIVVAIIAVIVIVVLIYKFVIQNNAPAATTSTTTTKRFVLPANHRVVSGQPWAPTEEAPAVPGLKWTRDNNLAVLTEGRAVVPGVEWTPPTKKERRFVA